MWLSPSLRVLGFLSVTIWLLRGCGGNDSITFFLPPGIEERPDASVVPLPDDGSAPGGPLDAGGEPPDAGSLQCAGPSGSPHPLKLTPIVTGLSSPLYVAAAPGDDSRLFVVERAGVIRIVQDGQLLPEPFLDLTDRVITFAAEDGLLGLAFHPDYANNGRFFVHYATAEVGVAPDAGDAPPVDADAGIHIARGASVISEFRRTADPNVASPASERRVLVVQQLSTNHNGGMLAFGPADGLLYLGMGDGDGIGDRNHQAQGLSNLTGKILRIDVDGSTDGLPYAIPAGNMTGAGVRPEIWSYGLRNPWRFSFDPCTNDLYLGDVGQYAMEEINYEPGNLTGHNYGWNIVEGTLCYDPVSGCDPSGTQVPVLTYAHTQGCAVTAGYVYRGQNIPSLRGTYVYADYCRGTFGTFRMQAGVATEQQDITADINPTGIPNIPSFGVDNRGELYAVSLGGGVYRIDPE
jgi:glucose/arabinose dehydrogenase